LRGRTGAMSSPQLDLVTACLFYMLCSAGMSVFNKLAVRALPLPITLVCIQMTFTIVSVLSRPKSIQIGSVKDALRWGLSVPMLFAAMLVSSMVAMEHNTLGTIVVFRNVAPLFTLFIERMFRVPMAVSCETVLALLSIVVGVALYHLHTLGLTTMGLIAVCLNMAFAVLERLTQRHLMAQRPVDISNPGMMLLNNACGLVPCTLLMFSYGEPARWSAVGASMTAGDGLLVLASCINGLAISYAGLRVQQLVTATSFMVLTNVNKFVVIIFGVVALHDTVTPLSALGVLMAMGGGVWYGVARARMQEFSPSLPAPDAKGKGSSKGDARGEDQSGSDQETDAPLLGRDGARDLEDGGQTRAISSGGAVDTHTVTTASARRA